MLCVSPCQTELSKCWAARTFAESKLSELQSEIDALQGRVRAAEGSSRDHQRRAEEQAVTLDTLRKEAEFNCENAALFKAEQERCLALAAEVHATETGAALAAEAHAEERARLTAQLEAEAVKTQSLKARSAHTHTRRHTRGCTHGDAHTHTFLYTRRSPCGPTCDGGWGA